MTQWKKLLPGLMAAVLLTGCTVAAGPAEDPVYLEAVTLEEIALEGEAVALAAGPAAVDPKLMPVASGTAVVKTDKAVIDYSNAKDGYVMVRFTAASDKKLKARVYIPGSPDKDPYTYNLKAGEWATLPLSGGNGSYTVKVMENTVDTKYAVVASTTVDVTLTDEFAPFLRPNQYVDYSAATATVAKAEELVAGMDDPLKKVEAVYNFVVKEFTYDKDRAANVQSDYLPVLDSVLAEKKGICFDYAALMAGMLRSQEVPCKLVVGYAGTQYHAWISVYTQETGWIEGVVYFDGQSWQRMDPTFASSANGSEAIMKYIGDGKNYAEKKLY